MKKRWLATLAALPFVCLFFAVFTVTAFAAGGEGIRIAVIDTGVSEANLNADKVLNGENYVFPNMDTSDRDGYGTAVAGIILGSENLGIQGIAPNAEIVPLVWLDHYPSGTEANGGVEAISNAIYDAVDEYDCDIINISAGISEDSPLLRKAVVYAETKGVVVVASAGNDNLTDPNSTIYPAGYDTVIGVGAWDRDDGAADFSQRHGVDIIADGVSITAPSNKEGKKYIVSGTSFSSPAISAACALILEQQPELTPEEIRQMLYTNTVDLENAGYDDDTGWGLVKIMGINFDVFADVSSDDWFAQYVKWAVDRGVFDGVSNSLFDPNGSMTRAMAVTVLWRLSGEPEAENADFTDVDPGMWYSQAVAWAEKAGIAEGGEDGRFRPNEYVSREQLAALLYRYAKYTGESAYTGDELIDDYTDGAAVSDYAREAMDWAVAKEIISGRGDGELAPDGTATRAEVAAIFSRYAAA